jgi:hypothetical protein
MSAQKGDTTMNPRTLVEKVRIGAAEVQVAIAGSGLLPTADSSACCCCCCCCGTSEKE